MRHRGSDRRMIETSLHSSDEESANSSENNIDEEGENNESKCSVSENEHEDSSIQKQVDLESNNDKNHSIDDSGADDNGGDVGKVEAKSLIHTSLKRAKIYVVRNLIQKVTTLRSKKGSEAQIAKHLRKAERMSKVMETIKQFIISNLTERTLRVFQGTAESIYLDMWQASSNSKKVESLIDTYMKMECGEEKFSYIGYLRLLSCKGVQQKLQAIAEAVSSFQKPVENPWKRKRHDSDEKEESVEKRRRKEERLIKIKERNKQKKKEKKKQIIKEIRKEKRRLKANNTKKRKPKNEQENPPDAPGKEIVEKNCDINNISKTKNKENAVVSCIHVHNDTKANIGNKISSFSDNNKRTNVTKENSKNLSNNNETSVKDIGCDDFFISNVDALDGSEQDVDGNEPDQEFCAPVTNEKPIVRSTSKFNRKRNRMGQRERKKLQLQQQTTTGSIINTKRAHGGDGASNYRNKNNPRDKRQFNSNPRTQSNIGDRKKQYRNKTVTLDGNPYKEQVKKEKVDESLHPSWQAKQRLKSQQGLSVFTGTKITFH